MAIAVALILIVVGSVLFHFLSPWTLAPLASNWGSIDFTILITLIITGLVFIAVTLFVALAVFKFRHKDGQKAAYEPENKKLELWLTGITTVGIVAMLAPGLIVYADFVEVPEEAMEVEVVGQQWSWTFRFPGPDGKLGKSAVEFISIDNPLGLDPLDQAGQDDKLVISNEVTLPKDRPVKLWLRSKDVLHDFYVPQFRVKMDMVPGTVSYMWFTPTVLGEYEILCAEYCGIGHFNMRGLVQVVEQADFDTWLASQPSFVDSVTDNQSQSLSVQAEQGKSLAQSKGCVACHNFENAQIGPSWKGLYGTTQVLADGREVMVDDDYLRKAILEPAAEMVQGFAPIMPAMPMEDNEVAAIIAYIKEQGGVAGESKANKPMLSGQALAQNNGCLACHSIDGSRLVGPSWQGLFGIQRELADGQRITVDDAYLMESIFQPNAKLVAGYPGVMPPPMINQAEAKAIIDYIKTL